MSDRLQMWVMGILCQGCGEEVCQSRDEAVRWWDADDGWKMGILCQGCAARGPHIDDSAYSDQA